MKKGRKHHVSKCFIEKPKSKDNLQKTAKNRAFFASCTYVDTIHIISVQTEKKKYFFTQQAGKELKK
jgi:hypothetical protein